MKTQRSKIWQAESNQRSGAVAVEFAITAPVLFLLLFGAIELSHANMVLHTVEAAAYEGSRQGIVPGASAGDCRRATRELLDIAGIRAATIQVTPSNLNTVSDTVTVGITVPYNRNTIITPLFTDSLVMRRQCSLQRE